MRATHPASDPGSPPAGYGWPLDLATRRHAVPALSFPPRAAEARHA